jgi:hypothetical protein
MLIIYIDLGRGWAPITHMANLAAELFEADLQVVSYCRPSALKHLSSVLLRRDRDASEECLVIAPSATFLPAPLLVEDWRKRFRTICGWVIDSFWEDHIPRFLRHSNLYDHFFVTTHQDIGIWSGRVNASVQALPWGSDVLRLGGGDSDRPWDLLRVGRQPADWDDDGLTGLDAKSQNVIFHGRPVFIDDAMEGQKMLMRLYRQSKYLLAFSNRANPTNYTHPTREYLTARWVDALACGTAVAGIPPREQGEADLLWEGALLDLGTTSRRAGLSIIAEAARAWTDSMAKRNHLQALKRLDWRLRFKKIAGVMHISPPLLVRELAGLENRIESLES